jgi:hypothetical protein
MRKHVTNLRQFFLVGVAAFCSIFGRGNPSSAADLQITRDNSTVSIVDGDKPVLRYRYADVPTKPCADQLVSPAGVQVLRDSPHDHKHHHALMFALAVDKVNFWEENSPKCGKEIHKSFADVRATVVEGVSRAGFVEELDWVGPAADEPLLVERREIEVLQAADLG